MTIDGGEKYCIDCSDWHRQSDMVCCNRCKFWSCKPMTLDPYAEVCDTCMPDQFADDLLDPLITPTLRRPEEGQ